MKRIVGQDKKNKTEEFRAVRRKVLSDFWLEFSRHFRPWLHELTRQYKERGNYPLMSYWLLPSYYQEKEDVEIAALASILIKNDEKVLERVEAFRQMFGSSPYKWFWSRGFVPLSIGATQMRNTGGVLNKRIAEYFNRIYGIWERRELVMHLVFKDFFGEINYQDRYRMLRLILSHADGFGRGVWATIPPMAKSPLTGDVFALLRTFFPDYLRLHDTDYAIHLFGFEMDSDFFYAALAYKELQRRNPKGCSRLATLYQKRYRESNILRVQFWNGDRSGILPEINFD